MTEKDLHKCQHFLTKFLACNQISSMGFCSDAFGANRIQVICHHSGSQFLLTAAKKSFQYLMEVKGYLANYQSNLDQAINDKNLEKENFRQLKQTLDSFVWGTKEPLGKTQTLLNLTNQLLGR